jgi:prespore-specific regulator
METKNANQRGNAMTATTAKQRQDAWTQEDDNVLVECVLCHIREGGTQLAAFDEAAERLERTSAACGFRWNATLRKCYENEITEAKIARQNVKGGNAGSRARTRVSLTKQADTDAEIFVTVSQLAEPNVSFDYLDQIINLAQNQKRLLANMANQIKMLNEQLSSKEKEVEQLKRRLDEEMMQPSELTINEDYNTLLQILQRARQLGAIDEIGKEKAAFKMDANGNIEMIG